MENRLGTGTLSFERSLAVKERFCCELKRKQHPNGSESGLYIHNGDSFRYKAGHHVICRKLY
jgi:hypothetical protein